MACGAASKKSFIWLMLGMIASTRSQPVTVDALQEEVEAEGVPRGVRAYKTNLEDLGTDSIQAISHIKAMASSLEQVFQQGRQLQAQVADVTGRQTAATLATSLGGLFRPAITSFVAALTMNSATSVTNAITSLLGGRSLDLIPAETFMTAPIGRDGSVLQPTRDSAEEVLKRRVLKRKQRQPASTTQSNA